MKQGVVHSIGIAIMKISKIILHTALLPELKSFYGNTLSLPISEEDEKNCIIHTRDTKLEFKHAAAGTSPVYHFAFNIPSNKIKEAQSWLQERVALLWLEEYNSYIADFSSWNAHSVYFKDPAGNIVEFIARHNINDEVREDFNQLMVRNISEIGLVFSIDYFDEQVKEFVKNHSLEYFDKQPPLPQFRAIGDDMGLFIAVPENRPWFPTNDAISAINPMEINFEVGGISQVATYE